MIGRTTELSEENNLTALVKHKALKQCIKSFKRKNDKMDYININISCSFKTSLRE